MPWEAIASMNVRPTRSAAEPRLWFLEVRQSLPRHSRCVNVRGRVHSDQGVSGRVRISPGVWRVRTLVCTAANLFDAPLHDGAPTEEHVEPAVRDSGAWPVGDAEVWVKLIHTHGR